LIIISCVVALEQANSSTLRTITAISLDVSERLPNVRSTCFERETARVDLVDASRNHLRI